MKTSESIIELAKAMAAFQGEVKQPTKDGNNPHFRSSYVTLDGVVAAVTETASKHGLSFMQFPINDGERIGVKTLVMHTSGEFIESEPVYSMPMKKDPQAAGSVITYLKRYSLAAIFGITSDVDDDGNQGSAPPPQYQQQSQQQNYQQAPQYQQQSNGLTEAQNKAMYAKLKGLESATQMAVEALYNEAQVAAGVPVGIPRKDLTFAQAKVVIDALAQREKSVGITR